MSINQSSNSNQKAQRISYVLLGLSVFFYLFFALWDGAVICVDSPTYIQMSFSREPIYPLLLAFFRMFTPGKDTYLLFTVIFQSLFAAFCGWFLADTLRSKTNLSMFLSIPFYALPLMVSLMCRFVAKRSVMYTNSILTEGITTSLYLLFTAFCLLHFTEQKKKWFYWGSITIFLMISTRKQMYFTLVLWVGLAIYQWIVEKKGIQVILTYLLSIAIVFVSAYLLDCSYNYMLRGQFSRHSSDNRFVTTMLFYMGERDDSEYIDDAICKELYLQIYDRCEDQSYLGHSAGEKWLEKVTHFQDHYDHIQIDTLWPMMMEQAQQNIGGMDDSLWNIEADRMNTVIIKAVLPHKIPRLLQCLWNNFLSGLVTTVAQCKPILCYASAVLYGLYMLLLSLLTRKIYLQKKNGFVSAKESEAILFFGYYTLLGIISNVGLVSAVIFCQTRYTIYNMPLFYMGLWMLTLIVILFNKQQ